MMRGVGTKLLSAVIAVAALAACAPLTAPAERRAVQGPTAEEIWTATMMLTTGREPSHDEKYQWDLQIDRRITQYLRRHPEVANSPEVQIFRFLRQVTVGMTREQVTVLLGAPTLTVTDAAEIEKLARGYWPAIKPKKVTEAWLYPQGWRLYLNDVKLVDITQYLERTR